jgi:hypothetical protein
LDKRCDEIEGRKGLYRSRYELSTACREAGRQMSSINMIILKMIEILQKLLNMWVQWKEGLESEPDPRVKKWGKAFDSSFQRKVGFHNIKQANWKSISGFPSFFSCIGFH